MSDNFWSFSETTTGQHRFHCKDAIHPKQITYVTNGTKLHQPGLNLTLDRDTYRDIQEEQHRSNSIDRVSQSWPELSPRLLKTQINTHYLRNFLKFSLLKDYVTTSSTRICPSQMNRFTHKDFLFFNFQLTCPPQTPRTFRKKTELLLDIFKLKSLCP